MERIAMSQEERDWLDWLKRARDGQVTQKWAAEKMGVSDRWVRRLLTEMRAKGDGVVVHGLRGRLTQTRSISKITDAHGDGRVSLRPNAPLTHDTGEDMYDA